MSVMRTSGSVVLASVMCLTWCAVVAADDDLLGRAKDLGSAAVFLSLLLCATIRHRDPPRRRHRGRPVFVRDDHARMLRDVADNGLAAIPDRHVLHGDRRFAMAPIAVERLDLGRKRAGQPA